MGRLVLERRATRKRGMALLYYATISTCTSPPFKFATRVDRSRRQKEIYDRDIGCLFWRTKSLVGAPREGRQTTDRPARTQGAGRTERGRWHIRLPRIDRRGEKR